MLDFAKSQLYATTKYGQISVPIYHASRKELGCEGYTHWQHGRMEIAIASEILKDERKLNRLLMHEFTHVIEYLNDSAYLSSEVSEDCTALARTIEYGMSQLWENLTVSSQRTAKRAPGKSHKAEQRRRNKP